LHFEHDALTKSSLLNGLFLCIFLVVVIVIVVQIIEGRASNASMRGLQVSRTKSTYIK
jgi:hypothetical protein